MKSSWNNMLDRLSNWIDLAILNLPNFIVALIVFIIAIWLSKNLQRWSSKALSRLIKQPSVRSLVSKLLSALIIAMGLFMALGVLNLDTVLTSLLAGAGVAGLAIGLALQGTLSNTFSGIFLAVDDILNVGDWIETNGYSGTVVEIDLRCTKIKESDNNLVIIPNKTILENPFKNYGLTTRIRTSITCGVSYQSNLQEVKALAISTIQKIYPPLVTEQIEFHYLNFGESSIDFQLRFWVNATANITSLEAKSEAIINLKDAFDENNIEIPYPIRTIFNSDK